MAEKKRERDGENKRISVRETDRGKYTQSVANDISKHINYWLLTPFRAKQNCTRQGGGGISELGCCWWWLWSGWAGLGKAYAKVRDVT